MNTEVAASSAMKVFLFTRWIQEQEDELSKQGPLVVAGMTNGGYWDKRGNLFEDRWALSQLIRMTAPDSDIESLEREAVGEDEKGVDLWVNRKNSTRECHQCKLGPTSKNDWTISDLKREQIFTRMRFQLERNPNEHRYYLISTIHARTFERLLTEAIDSDSSEKYWVKQISGDKKLRKAFVGFCGSLSLNPEIWDDVNQAWTLLRGTRFVLYCGDEFSDELLAERLGSRLDGNPLTAISILESWLRRQLRQKIDTSSVAACLEKHGLRLISGETGRFIQAGLALATKRAQQGQLPKFEAELDLLCQDAKHKVNHSRIILGDRWQLVSLLSRGGFAEVWLGLDQKSRGAREGRPDHVAVKLLRADRASDEAMRRRFVDGALRIKRLADSRIVQVVSEPRQDQDRFFYVMEYQDGSDLESWALQESMPLPNNGGIIGRGDGRYGRAVRGVLAETAAGLGTLHREGLIHGDVKPANILVDDAGRVKLCDFDLVRSEECIGGDSGHFGTMPFLAPEARSGKANTVLSDQYAFAATIVRILAGEDWSSVTRSGEVADELERFSIDIALRQALLRALAREPGDRYESIQEFMECLDPKAFSGLS